MKTSSIQELSALLSAASSDEALLEFAQHSMGITELEARVVGREALNRIIGRNADALLPRLMLAKSLFDDGMLLRCVDELELLSAKRQLPAIDRLLTALGGSRKSSTPLAETPSATDAAPVGPVNTSENDEGEVLAELDVDFDFDEALEGLTDDKE